MSAKDQGGSCERNRSRPLDPLIVMKGLGYYQPFVFLTIHILINKRYKSF